MAALYPQPYAYYETPCEIVDHPHERLHQHNTFLGVISRKKPDQKTYPNHPDVDFSDAISHYTVEVELPGIQDVNRISLTWTSWKTLVLTGSSFRDWQSDISSQPDDGKKNSGTPEMTTSANKDYRDDKDETAKGSSVTDSEQKDGPPYLLIGERRIGTFRREFHFPVSVEVEKVEASLKAGLLRIIVPKKSHTYPKGSGKIVVRSMD